MTYITTQYTILGKTQKFEFFDNNSSERERERERERES